MIECLYPELRHDWRSGKLPSGSLVRKCSRCGKIEFGGIGGKWLKDFSPEFIDAALEKYGPIIFDEVPA